MSINLASLLQEEICSYLKYKSYDLSDAANIVYQTIVQYVDCNLEKLALTLHEFNLMRKDKKSFDYKNDKIDISSENTQIYVKQISDKNKEPKLLFFNGQDKLPFLKIILIDNTVGKKVIIEYSNNPLILSNLKRQESILEEGFNYVFHDCYEFDKNGALLTTKKMLASTKGENLSENCKDLHYFNENSLNFANLIERSLMKNSNPIDGKFTENGLALFDSFFELVDSVLDDNLEFSFYNLMQILNSLLISDNKQNHAINGIIKTANINEAANIISHNLSGNNLYEIETFAKNEQPLIVKVLKSANCLSLDIFNNDNFHIASYLINETDCGFTIFRNLETKKLNINPDFSNTLVINLSNNTLTFKTMGDAKQVPSSLTPKTIVLTVNANDDIKLNTECMEKTNIKSLDYTPKQKEY